MISVFATLKLRLLRNILRTDGAFAFVMFSVLALGFGAVASYTILAGPAPTDGLLPLVGFGVLLAWTFGPLLFGSSDETIDTTRLALFPVPAHHLAPGMATANLIGPGPVAVLLPFLAVAFRGADPLRISIGVGAAISSIVLASVLSRWVQTILGGALRKRNRRDIVIVLAGIFAGAMGVGSQVLIFVGLSTERIQAIGSVVRWFPGGWTGWALDSVRYEGPPSDLALPVVAILATIGLALIGSWRWIVALERALAEVTDSGVDELGRNHFMDSGGLIGRLNRRLGPYGPVLAKEIRYLRRHPRYRVQVVTQFIVLILGGAPFLAAILERDPASVLVACVPALTAGITSSNLLGADGRALWAEVLAIDSLRVLLRGRSLAFVLLGVAASMLVIVGTAAWTGGWVYAPVAFGAAVGMGLAGAGTGAYTSTLAPVLLPDETNPNPFASGDMGQGCVSGLYTIGGAFVGLLTAAPILVGLAYARSHPWAQVAVVLLAPLYGLGVYLYSTNRAARRADPRTPELLAILS